MTTHDWDSVTESRVDLGGNAIYSEERSDIANYSEYMADGWDRISLNSKERRGSMRPVG